MMLPQAVWRGIAWGTAIAAALVASLFIGSFWWSVGLALLLLGVALFLPRGAFGQGAKSLFFYQLTDKSAEEVNNPVLLWIERSYLVELGILAVMAVGLMLLLLLHAIFPDWIRAVIDLLSGR